MDKAVNSFFNFNEHTEIGEVAHLSCVAAAKRIFCLNVFPRIVLELLDAEAHLAVLAVKGEHNSLNLVADLHEVLCRTQVLAP